MAAQKIKIPPRRRARYNLLDSARKDQLGSIDWSEGLTICDDPCTEAFYIAPQCDKFIKWDVADPTKPLEITLSVDPNKTGAAQTVWTLPDATTTPSPAVGASITAKFRQPGTYYVEAVIPATATTTERRQVWPLDVGGCGPCGDCRDIQPIMLFSELCSDGPNWDIDMMREAVRQDLEATASAALERAAWTGYGSNSPRLVEDNLLIINTPGTAGIQAVSVAAALAGIEEHLAAAEGTIHMGIRAANLLMRDHLLVKDDDRLWTAVGGHMVIAGTGYDVHQGPNPYTLPDGTTDNSDSYVVGDFGWMVGHSGPVWVDRQGVEVVEFINTRTNVITVRAEQLAAVVWQGCRQVGALADLGC